MNDWCLEQTASNSIQGKVISIKVFVNLFKCSNGNLKLVPILIILSYRLLFVLNQNSYSILFLVTVIECKLFEQSKKLQMWFNSK